MKNDRYMVINVVGLSRNLVGAATPNISAFIKAHAAVSIKPSLPAVTCTVQASMVTGKPPSEHGIVANGWYFREQSEVWLWRQSDRLVQAPKIWQTLKSRDPAFSCAKTFWWYNMVNTDVDFSVTPRPIYRADGLKIPDIYTQPKELYHELVQKLGPFPLFEFWGPRTTIRSSCWISEAAKYIETKHQPNLHFVYLPHLDYNLQRLGPSSDKIATDLEEIDAVVGDLLEFSNKQGVTPIILSEYGMSDVETVIPINKVLREAGLIAVRDELGGEVLDPGASKAFALCDHQIAHIYVNDNNSIESIRRQIAGLSGVAQVYTREEAAEIDLNHNRSGDFVVLAEPHAWFSYYYWLDDRRAPDFARTVDIHRKPGYDPVELFIDPNIQFPVLKAGLTLLKKKLGFRYLMDLIPLDPSLVKGSHGVLTHDPNDGPLFAMANMPAGWKGREQIKDTEVYYILSELF